MGGNGYALDVLSAVRYAATELGRVAPAALPITDLAAGYTHVIHSDLVRIREHERCADDQEATVWLIAKALAEIEPHSIGIVRDGDSARLGVPFAELRYSGRKIEPLINEHAQLRDPMNPMSGVFAENIRTDKLAASKDDLGPLRESMRALGWVPEFPALQDERGVVLVGHRRLRVAAELGIAVRAGVEIHTLIIGDGDEHDARRLRIALASNIGFKPLSPTDRKRIAEVLYGDHEWTMQRIGEALNVSTWTVSNDLRGFEATSKPSRPKGGRPKKSKPRKAMPDLDQEVRARVEAGQAVQRDQLAQQYGVGHSTVERAQERALGAIEEGQRLAAAEVTDHEHHGVCEHCGMDLTRP